MVLRKNEYLRFGMVVSERQQMFSLASSRPKNSDSERRIGIASFAT